MKLFGMCPSHRYRGHLHCHLHLTSHHSRSLLSHTYPSILRHNLAANSSCAFDRLADAAECTCPSLPPLGSSTPHSCRCFLSLLLGSGVHWLALSGFLPTLLRSQHGAIPQGTARLLSLSLHASSALTHPLSHTHAHTSPHSTGQMLSSGHGDSLRSAVLYSYHDPLLELGYPVCGHRSHCSSHGCPAQSWAQISMSAFCFTGCLPQHTCSLVPWLRSLSVPWELCLLCAKAVAVTSLTILIVSSFSANEEADLAQPHQKDQGKEGKGRERKVTISR